MTTNSGSVKSGKYHLRKMTKTQVKMRIRDKGVFHGFMCGNKANPFHIADGWYLGMKVDITNIQELEDHVDSLTTSLNVYTPELGRYPHYYLIVSEDEPTGSKRSMISSAV